MSTSGRQPESGDAENDVRGEPRDEQAGPAPEDKGPNSPEPDPEEWEEDDGFDRLITRVVINAQGGNVNAGGVLYGGQRAAHHTGREGDAGRRVQAREGPIPADEILGARRGFAEPDWFAEALRVLDGRILFLAGEPGSGRRTAALNLLYRHSGGSLALSAVDSDNDLASWKPSDSDIRGYLMDGRLLRQAPHPGLVGTLRKLLEGAGARMLVLLPDDPELLREWERELHISPIRCQPPPPKRIFEARLMDRVPDEEERERLLSSLDPGLLDELLVPELAPAEVAELVDALVRGDGSAQGTDLRDQLSFLAESEAPSLISKLREDPDALAFLLALCVFEGFDHRIVREEADRLLALADGRLDHLLPPPEGQACTGQEQLPNPRFVFRRSLDDLLHRVRAYSGETEVRSAASFDYTTEPVRFTRHRKAEAVLRHVWRQYGQLSGLLTEWLDRVDTRYGLAEPVGRVMGMAAGWGGGRQALKHIRHLAHSEKAGSRSLAAFALGVAAEDPVLASEVKYRLRNWSYSSNVHVRSTVALTCGTEFGQARPEWATGLLRHLVRRDDDEFGPVQRAVRDALTRLFASGAQAVVFAQATEWIVEEGRQTALALRTMPRLLVNGTWFQEQLVDDGEYAQTIVALVHRCLNEEATAEDTTRCLLYWCHSGAWSDRQHRAVEVLLTALARDIGPGELGLFHEIDRREAAVLSGRHIAEAVLDAWRNGQPVPSDFPRTHTAADGRTT
ncbi:hypothetical protein [Streptomyces sp. NPDC005438]|uniref:hypothetical protein n=1 Tax=Streptomyces sp. NPDC005438 TaxID=3156880 RepID=UPI0033B2E1FA